MSSSTRLRQAAIGGQRYLIITSVPSGASPGLKGQRLVGQTLTVAGDYYCRLEIGGLTECYVHTTATIAAGTASTDVTTVHLPDADVTDATLHASHAYQGFSNDGSLTTTVKQTAEVTALHGEQYAVYKLTLASSPNVTFTRAELNGL